ncbi:hypothetical protein FOG51_01781 [Hanseniaspora uvarum]|nr:hypothetical protein FOG51_01781 [Hanseniaspora uvarum]
MSLEKTETSSVSTTESDKKPQSNNKKELFHCFLIALVGCTFGQDMGISPTYQFPSFKHNFKVHNTWINGIIVSIFNIGCAIGGIVLSKLSNYYGRKFAICVASFIFLIGCMVQLIPSSHYGQIIAGRFITGLSVGTTAVVAPSFITETVSDPKLRGSAVVLYQFCVVSGIIYGNIVTLITSRKYDLNSNFNNNQWRIPIGFGMVWGLVVLVGMIFVPESKIYYKQKEQKNMNKIMSKEEKVQQQLNNESHSWKETFVGKPRLGLRLVIGCFLMFFQQASGINYFFYYGSVLFSSVGLNDSYETSIIFSLVNFLGTIAGVYFVSRAGRKIIFLSGCIGGFVSMIIYASLGSFALVDSNGVMSKSVGGCMIAFTCIFIICFAVSLGPITFVLVSELYPVRTKSLSMGIATNCNWLTNFLITLLTPTITSKIGYKYGYVFAACLGAAIIFTIFLVPETKGLSSEQIDELFMSEQQKEEKALFISTLSSKNYESDDINVETSRDESLEKDISPDVSNEQIKATTIA